MRSLGAPFGCSAGLSRPDALAVLAPASPATACMLGDAHGLRQGLPAAQSASGNAAKAGISAGDTIIYTSSFFGDELWPADKLGFANSAINACPSPVAFVYVKVPTRALRSKTLLQRWT